jgi:hypothetical protein
MELLTHQTNNIMIYKFLILLVLGCFGCTTLKYPNGIYLSTDSDNSIQTSFHFKNDGTLEVKSWSDVGGEIVETGNWFTKNDTLFTPNTVEKNNAIEYSISKSPDSILTIKLYDKMDSVGINLAKVYINSDTVPISARGNGIYQNDDLSKKVDFVKLNYMTQSYIFDFTKSKDFNVVTFYWDFEKNRNDIDYCQTWIIEGKKLIPLQNGYSSLKKN